MNTEDRIQELEAKVAELTAALQMQHAARQAPAVQATSSEAVEPTRSSRRGMLKLAGAAAVGAAAAAATQALPAAAASGGNFLLGQSNTTDVGDPTTHIGVLYALADSSNIVTFGASGSQRSGTVVGWNTTSTSDTIVRGGVMGVSNRFFGLGSSNTAHGVLGVQFDNGAGSGVFGESQSSNIGGSAGLRARSLNGPAIQLVPVATGAPTAGAWLVGALQPDTAGNVWLCVASGTPGTWRKVSGPATAGSFHALTPGRVYDSRSAAPTPGTLASGATRTVSVADRRDTGNGAVVEANFVPAGATAVSANLTITDTVNGGFLAVNPGGNTTINASAINWSSSGQNVANGLTLTLNANREITVIGGGGGITNFIVDILGYYL